MDAETKKYTNLLVCVAKLLQFQVYFESAHIDAFPEDADSTKL